MKSLRVVACLVFAGQLCFCDRTANADIIDFDGFSTGAFAAGSEDGYALLASSATVRDVGAGQHVLEHVGLGLGVLVDVTHGTDLFNFNSIDLGELFGTGGVIGDVVLTGFTSGIGGTVVGTETFSSITGALTTFAASGGLLGTDIDALRINLGLANTFPRSLDNINLTLVTPTAVPEPSSLALLAMGGFGYLSFRRRRRTANVSA